MLERALRLIEENSFLFNGKNCLQAHGTARGTKMADAFANIFMKKVETDILSQSVIKTLVWKRFMDVIFPLWNVSRNEISKFIEQANKHHPTIKFTAEISETETAFLDTSVYKGERFKKAAESFIQNALSEVSFEDRKLALQQKHTENKRILPFVTQYQPSVPNLK